MTDQQDRRRFLQTSLVAGAALSVTAGSLQTGAQAAPGDEPATANPRVRPGRVTWHEDFDAARAASARSNKPVLLFQMMGRMDEKFC